MHFDDQVHGEIVRFENEDWIHTGERRLYMGEASKPLALCKAGDEYAHEGYRYRVVRLSDNLTPRFPSHYTQDPPCTTPPKTWDLLVNRSRIAPESCVNSEVA